MMFPLCTSVTLLRLFLMAYPIAVCTRRTLPEKLTGLIPMPTWTSVGKSFAPTSFQNSSALAFVPKRILSNDLGNSLAMKSRTFWASGDPAPNSMPA